MSGLESDASGFDRFRSGGVQHCVCGEEMSVMADVVLAWEERKM